MLRLIGDIVQLEDDEALIYFPSIDKTAKINVKDYPELEQYIIPGIRIVYEEKKLKIPILEWMKKEKIKLIESKEENNNV